MPEAAPNSDVAPTPDGAPLLEVEGLRVSYGAVRAVRDVSLRLVTGELVCLLGANGAGKSSTLLAIAGALPAGGAVRLAGADVSRLSPERRVREGLAMVPETRDVFPDLTVHENLRLGAFLHRGDGKGVEADMERQFARFPRLRERRTQAAGTLSGGEQQMLVIARALMSRPRLLLLDEPSLGLAPAIVDRIFEMIAELKREGLTILLVEQNAARALRLADRAYVLRLGRVAACGPARTIGAETDLAQLYLGG